MFNPIDLLLVFLINLLTVRFILIRSRVTFSPSDKACIGMSENFVFGKAVVGNKFL